MGAEEDIEGAFFYECAPEGLRCLETYVSHDMQRLARIYRMGDSHRVAYFSRGTEYNWAGEVWREAAQPSSIADTLRQAQSLASKHIAAAT